jgi:hypothetical protein
MKGNFEEGSIKSLHALINKSGRETDAGCHYLIHRSISPHPGRTSGARGPQIIGGMIRHSTWHVLLSCMHGPSRCHGSDTVPSFLFSWPSQCWWWTMGEKWVTWEAANAHPVIPFFPWHTGKATIWKLCRVRPCMQYLSCIKWFCSSVFCFSVVYLSTRSTYVLDSFYSQFTFWCAGDEILIFCHTTVH